MRGLKFQFSSALLTILTVAAVISAVINFQQQRKFLLPTDGATWVERPGGVRALYVSPGGPADHAGIRPGDFVLRVSGSPIKKATDVTRVLVGIGAWEKAVYHLRRRGIPFNATVWVAQVPRDFAALDYLYIVGLAYLAIGLFVYFRRGSAPMALHFYVLCLASFVFSTFHYTGKLNPFDKVMYYGNLAGNLFAPTIFLHFCLVFPRRRGRWWRVLALYLPACTLMAVFFGVTSGWLRADIGSLELSWLLDRVTMAYMAAAYLLGGLALAFAGRRQQDPIIRQQIKWLRNGALFGIGPFTAFYVIPYVLGAMPAEWMKASVLSLLLIPLTWAYAVVRYRLMDVDIIFQQGYVYTLATICVLGIFYGLIFSFGKFSDLGPTFAAVLILIAAFIFQPIRNWIQEVMDRNVFYKDRYDYRRTLVEFARELSSMTDLDAMLRSASDRLVHTLSLQRVAFFLSDEQARFHFRDVGNGVRGSGYDVSFLTPQLEKPYLFFEQTRHPLDVLSKTWPASVRQAIAGLDLTYYLPCSVRGKIICYLGVSRTDKGDFLTTEDVELLLTVSGYIGIAVENARLYRSLERKMAEYERLKEYSENIVESINVGILAVDLEDRVESWNSQMELLTGVTRDGAVGRSLAELFPEALAEQFDTIRGETGIHHIYRFVLRPASKVIEIRPSSAGVSPGAPETVLNIAVAPLVSKNQEQIGRLIIFDNITERDELERRLVQADKLSSIGLLAAGVAHEVNTPLAVISTYAQMLAKQIAPEDQKARLLDKIAKQTFRASEIVNSLLNFSRTSPTTFDDVNPNRLIGESLTLIEHQLEKAGIKVQLDLEEAVPPIKGNSGKLQQVLLNLFLNARDAMASGGTLTVRTRRQGDTVGVDIVDTGHGIQPENLGRIFDPFFTTKAGRRGTGLGLSVSYGIVREHAGAIEVESQPGEGTRFHLVFPLARKAVHA